jgi:hypothetical protein
MLADAGRVVIEKNRRVTAVFEEFGIPVRGYRAIPSAPPLCFMHIPKTGGASVIMWLESMFPTDAVAPCRNTVDFEILREHRHDYQLFAGHFLGRQAKLFPENAQWMVILRDPVAMAVSAYHHRRLAAENDWEADRAELPEGDPLRGDDSTDKALAVEMSELFRTADFQTILKRPLENLRSFFRDTLLRRFGATEYEEAAFSVLDDDAPELKTLRAQQWKRAIALLDSIDLVGDHAELDQFLLLLAASRGWPAPPPLARIHDFGAPTRSDSASPELRAAVTRYSPIDEKLYARSRERSAKVNKRLSALCGGTTADDVNALHRRRFFDDNPPLFAFDVTAHDAWNGVGWGMRERDGMRNPFRQIANGRDATMLARLDPAINEYRLFVHVWDASSEEVLAGFSVQVAGVALERVDTAWREGALILEWRLPSNLLATTRGQIEFLFLKAESTREHALSIARIGCVPALSYA